MKKPDGPLIYTVSKGCDAWPRRRRGYDAFDDDARNSDALLVVIVLAAAGIISAIGWALA